MAAVYVSGKINIQNYQAAGDNNNTLTLTQTVAGGFSSMYLVNPLIRWSNICCRCWYGDNM